ncbi:guanylate-binding protein 2-like isoform X1 [Petromyzon marinus]|uniref:Guanylate-binding protein 1-like n=2 Tax=Petromyzon marinus TaxID=7757 RepID=A0AAJ7TBB3_PETMA|nr:guanylate-binding protein 1-like [Petromyzon marinus]
MSQGAMAHVERPLPFILTDEDGRFYVDEKTAGVIASIRQPVVVVAIAGRYRTGKSYLMNRLAGSNNGFSLGNTVQSHTKGIWIWPRAHPLHKDKCLLLIDTEGLGDVEKAGDNHDTWLFVMAVLLSTTLVWNTTGVLSKDGFDQLHFVANMTEHVRTKIHQREDEVGQDFKRYFPSFVVCVRDFTLKLEIEGKACDADQYLEHCLGIRKKGMTANCRSFNEQRELLSSFFKKRKCFVFPMPTHPEDLHKLETISEQQLNPEFLQTAEDFTTHILQTAHIKHVDNAVLTGPLFLKLTEQYVNSQRSGDVPCIESALTQVVTLANMQAREDAMSLYEKRMEAVNQQLPLPIAKLNEFHQHALEQAVEAFHQRSVLDCEHKHEKELMDSLVTAYDDWNQKNKDTSMQRCKQRLSELYEPIRVRVAEKIFIKPGGYQEYKRMMDAAEKSYRTTQGLGDEMEAVLLAFIDLKKEEGHLILMMDKSVTELQKQRIETEEMEKRLVQQQRALENTNAQQEAQISALKMQMETNQRSFSDKLREVEKQTDKKLESLQKEHEHQMKMFSKKKRGHGIFATIGDIMDQSCTIC